MQTWFSTRTRILVKLLKRLGFKFKHWFVNDSSHQIKKLITWFLNLSFDESIDKQRNKVWISNLRPYEAQQEDQKPSKTQEYHLEERKVVRPTKCTKSGKIKGNARRAKKSTKPKSL
jgi:arginyl-tRNA synthetase